MSQSFGAEQAAQVYASPSSLQAFNDDIVAQFRANGGRIVSGPLAGAPLLLMTVDGAVVPLAYVRDGDGWVIVASNGGAADNPTWYDALRADPEVAVEVGTETFRARATEATGSERDRLYAAVAAALPVFAHYAARTARVIPVLVLRRI
jgi:deazaflavin-dependent oxidoreductase (nitroreductase family)